MHFDDILTKYLGEFGRYQKIQFLLIAAPCILVSMEVSSWTFTGASIPYRCALPDEPENSSFSYPFSNVSDTVFRSALLERNFTIGNLTSQLKCSRLSLGQDSNGSQLLSWSQTCSSYKFDNSEVHYTATQRWEIVCARKFIQVLVQNAYYLGQIIGSLAFGYLGDRFGRKKCFIAAIIIEGTTGIAMAFVPVWQAFAFLRIFLGVCHPGIFIVANVIGLELVGPKKRLVASVITGIFFALGQVLLSGLAFLIRNYQYLQLAVSTPTLLFLVYWWLVPESTRWLLTNSRHEEADRQLQKAAKINRTSLPAEWWKLVDDETPKKKQADGSSSSDQEQTRIFSYLDIFRSPVLRNRLFLCWVFWPITSMIYYGITVNPGGLAQGGRYLTFALSGLVEIPGTLIPVFLLNVVGRKPLAIIGYLVSGSLLLATLAKSLSDNVAALTVCVVISKLSITMVYSVIYSFTPEQFPTVVRAQALGTCSVVSRFGSMFASYLVLYLIDEHRVPVFLVLGCSALVAACAVFFLPETTSLRLADTIAEGEKLGSDQGLFEFRPWKKAKVHPEASAKGNSIVFADSPTNA